MTNDSKNSDDLPNGSGQGSTDDDAPDTTSGGSPEQSK
jgi:hypothetical protein